ncbi:MAG: hypothetical protein AM325_010145 [Candidatus Thorarchaeota archaeon SMTZ1-45]|nr:MAG: hypothetical protein AM325_11735 [Candidatus Thorarchaeota archaeon SMTZ1-45]
MKNRFFAILVILSLIAVINPGIVFTASALESPQNSLAQVADLQFTADMVLVTVEQGGSNTANIRVHNYGGEAGSANITFLGSEPDGITVELSTISIIDLSGGTYEDIITNVSAEAGLWPLGPRRLDLGLMNGTTELDSMYIEMNVVAPTTTSTGILGIPNETIILSVIATIIVVAVVLIIKRR